VLDAAEEDKPDRPHHRLDGWAAPLSHVADAFQAALRILVAVGMAALGAVVLTQVVGRYFFLYTPVWSEVLAGYLVVWITFLGAAYLVRTGGHLSVSLMASALPKRLRLMMEVVASVAWVLFTAVVLGAGVQQYELTVPMRSLGLDISASWLYLAVPVFAGFSLLFLAEQLVAAIKHALQGDGR